MPEGIEPLMDMARSELRNAFLGITLAERPISVVISLGMFLARWNVIPQFRLWTLAPKADPTLKMV
jgi:hypothetical protein